MARIRLCLVGAIALVAINCQDHGLPTAAGPPISAEFFDATHGGGNPHFYLLPPLVSTPDLTKETFESGLLPSVRVTEMTASGTAFAQCKDELIAYLPASEFTPLKAYAAFWRPATFSNVAAPCIYRLQVELFGTRSKAGTVLGFADVQVISKTTLKYLKTGQYIPLPKDLTLPFWFFIGQGAVFFAQTGITDACRTGRDCAEAVLDPTKDNVVITKNQEAGIFIPKNAFGEFTDPITLVIEQQTERPCIPSGKLGLPQINANGTGCYRYRRFPSEVAQTQNLTVAMCVEVGLLTHDQADRLQIFRFDPEEDGGTATALQNAPAAFLPCEVTRFGLVTRLFNDLAALFGPRVLHAAAVHLGVGGSCVAGKCLSSPYFTWGLPGTLGKVSADPQVGTPGQVVGAPPSVQLLDPGNPNHVPPIPPQPIANATVRFEVVSGGGSITPPIGTGGSTVVLTTDPSGLARLGSWTLGSAPGTNKVQVVAPGANDTVTFTATSSAADLTIGQLEVQPANPTAGDALTLSGIVANSGGTASGPTTGTLCAVHFFSDGGSFGFCGGVDVPGLAPGGSAPINASLNPLQAGTYTVTANVDSAPNNVVESNENNAATGPTFTVAPASDVRIASVSLSSTTLTIGETAGAFNIPYTATIVNGTDATLSVVLIQAYVDQGAAHRAANGADVTCGPVVGALPPGTCPFAFSVEASNGTAGSGTLVPGDATARFELKRFDTVTQAETLLDTFRVPVTLVSPLQ